MPSDISVSLTSTPPLKINVPQRGSIEVKGAAYGGGRGSDPDAVKIYGDQTIDGNKTFTGTISASNIGTISSKNYTQSVSAPISPAEGDQWLRTDTLQKYEYYNSAWVSAGGSGGGGAQPEDSNTIIALSLFL